jgi:copper transport protein
MRRAAAIAVLVGALIVLGASSAGAHALVRSSDPADGAILDRGPAQVSITFTERPDPALSIVRVLDAHGNELQTGEPQPVPGQPLELEVGVRALGKGVYTVTWRIVSRADGHVTAGSFSFGVGVSPGDMTSHGSVTVPSTPSPSPLAAAGRWGLYVGLAMLVAAGPFWLFAFRGATPSVRVVAASWGLAAAGLAVVIVAERSTVGVSFSQLLRSSAGHALLWQGLGLLLVGLAVVWLALRRNVLALVAVTATAAVTMLLHARAGHAAAGRMAWVDVPFQWIHLMAVGVWIGGLAWLLTFRHGEVGDLPTPVKRFSTLAGVALGVVAISGIQRAISEVGGPTAWGRLFHAGFGVTLLIKIGLFGLLVALGARNRYVNVPGVRRDAGRYASLRRTVAAEVAIAAGILGVTGVLTQFPPPASVAASHVEHAHEQVIVTGNDFATTVRARLTATPGTVGPNRFEVRATDYDTGQPVAATALQLTFALPGRPEIGTPELALQQATPGVWTGEGTVLSMDGRWDVTVLIQEATGAVTVPLTLQTRLPPEQIQVQPAASGQPAIYTIALAGGVTVQTYIDPGTSGNNVVHFTFFQPDGKELPIESASALATPPGGVVADLPLIRFDPGHFVANATLAAGSWRFQVSAMAQDGTMYDAYFDQTIP